MTKELTAEQKVQADLKRKARNKRKAQKSVPTKKSTTNIPTRADRRRAEELPKKIELLQEKLGATKNPKAIKKKIAALQKELRQFQAAKVEHHKVLKLHGAA